MACAEAFNIFVSKSVLKLAIDRDPHVNKGAILNYPVSNIIDKFQKHLSIVGMNQKKFMPNSYSFNFVPENAVTNVINNIDSSEAFLKDNIPPSILKANVDISTNVLHNDINLNIEHVSFPVNIKTLMPHAYLNNLERFLKTKGN